MSLAPFNLGWSVKQMVVKPQVNKLMVVGGNIWSENGRVGYPGFNGGGSTSDTKYLTYSRAAQAAMVHYLTGKSSGANILICVDGPVSADASSFSTQFQDGLTAAGHSFTLTLSVNSFGGYEPTDFDLLCAGSAIGGEPIYHGLTTDEDKFDYVLDNGTSLLIDFWGSGYWERYGFTGPGYLHQVGGAIHTTDYYAPYWDNQRPFYCAPIGTELYALVFSTSWVVAPGVSKTKPGTSTIYDCTLHAGNGVIGIYEV